MMYRKHNPSGIIDQQPIYIPKTVIPVLSRLERFRRFLHPTGEWIFWIGFMLVWTIYGIFFGSWMMAFAFWVSYSDTDQLKVIGIFWGVTALFITGMILIKL